MSILTALLLVGAVAIMLIMHSVGHGRHGGHGGHADGLDDHEARDARPTVSRGDTASGAQRPTRKHGCC